MRALIKGIMTALIEQGHHAQLKSSTAFSVDYVRNHSCTLWSLGWPLQSTTDHNLLQCCTPLSDPTIGLGFLIPDTYRDEVTAVGPAAIYPEILALEQSRMACQPEEEFESAIPVD